MALDKTPWMHELKNAKRDYDTPASVRRYRAAKHDARRAERRQMNRQLFR